MRLLKPVALLLCLVVCLLTAAAPALAQGPPPPPPPPPGGGMGMPMPMPQGVPAAGGREREAIYPGRVPLPRRGSSASRSPSPSRLKPNTVSMIAMPGKKMRWGALNS